MRGIGEVRGGGRGTVKWEGGGKVWGDGEVREGVGRGGKVRWKTEREEKSLRKSCKGYGRVRGKEKEEEGEEEGEGERKDKRRKTKNEKHGKKN